MATEIGTYVVGNENQLGNIVFGIQPANTYVSPFDRKTDFDFQTGVNIKSVKECSAWGAGTSQLRNAYGSDHGITTRIVQSEQGSRVQGTIKLVSDSAKSYSALGINCVVEIGPSTANVEANMKAPDIITLPSNGPSPTITTNKDVETKSHTDIIVGRETYTESFATSIEMTAGADADGVDDGFILTINSTQVDLVDGDAITFAFPYFSTAKSNGLAPQTRFQIYSAEQGGLDDATVHAACSYTVEGEAASIETDSTLIGFNVKDTSGDNELVKSKTLEDLGAIALAPLSSSFLNIPISTSIPSGSTVTITCPKVTVNSSITIRLGNSSHEVPAPKSANLAFAMKHRSLMEAAQPGSKGFQSNEQLKLRTHNSAFTAGAVVGAVVAASSILAMFF